MRIMALFLWVWPMAVHAEVMDKESSAIVVWAWVIAPAVWAFLAARYMRWMLLLVLPPPIIFWISHLLEVTDPYIGSAIAQEAGALYLLASWGGPLVLALGVLLGWLLGLRGGSRR